MAGLESLFPWLQSGVDRDMLAGPGGFNPAAPPVQLDENGRPLVFGPDGTVIGDDITVDASVPSRPEFSQEQPELLPSYRNDYELEELQDVRDRAPSRKGMFGIKGTFRDILGAIGDTFLMASDNDPYYQPRRDRERASDAMVGFTRGGDQSKAAMERLAYENPELAQELYKIYNQAETNRANSESQKASRESMIQDRRYRTTMDMGNYAARLLAAAGDDPARQAQALAQIEQRAALFGIGLDDIGLSKTMDPDQLGMYSFGDMTVNQQQNLPLRQRQVATGEKNADTARINANRPRNPPPRPRADTELEYYRAVSNIPATERTAEETAFMQRYIQGTGGSRRSSGRVVPPPPANPRFKGWSVKRN